MISTAPPSGPGPPAQQSPFRPTILSSWIGFLLNGRRCSACRALANVSLLTIMRRDGYNEIYQIEIAPSNRRARSMPSTTSFSP